MESEGSPRKGRERSTSVSTQLSSSLRNRLEASRLQRTKSSSHMENKFESFSSVSKVPFDESMLAEVWPIGAVVRKEKEKAENEKHFYVNYPVQKPSDAALSSISSWDDMTRLLSTSFPVGSTPLIFECGNSQHLSELKNILLNRGAIRTSESLVPQLQHLLAKKYGKEILNSWSSEIPEKVQDFLENEAKVGRKGSVEELKASFGTWVYFPWINSLVHLLPKSFFKLLRNPNPKFSQLSIGIVGLCEGKDMALALAQEGMGERFHLMEGNPSFPLLNKNCLQFDETNVVTTSRELFELDPYLNVSVFTPQELDSFFSLPNNKTLDFVIDQTQSVPLKILLRQKAKERKIPVISLPSNYNIVDISLFNVQNDSALFQGSNLSEPFLQEAKSGQVDIHQFQEKLYKPYSDGDGFGKLSKSGIANLVVAITRKLVNSPFPHSACISLDINAFNSNINAGIPSASEVWTINGRPRSFSIDSRAAILEANYVDPVTGLGGIKSCVVRKALFAFQARKDKELSISVGDEIAVISENKSGWWKGKNLSTDQFGWFPSNYTRATEKKVDVNLDAGISHVTSADGNLTQENASPSSPTAENMEKQLSQEERQAKFKSSKRLSVKILELQAELAQQEKESKNRQETRARSNTVGSASGRKVSNFLDS